MCARKKCVNAVKQALLGPGELLQSDPQHPGHPKMNRSTKLFTVGTALSLPAWFISPSILPSALQIAWVGGILGCACAGAVYWFLEQR